MGWGWRGVGGEGGGEERGEDGERGKQHSKRERERERKRENLNSNSKTLLLKDSSVRSIWTCLTASPCYTTNTERGGDRGVGRREKKRDEESGGERKRETLTDINTGRGGERRRKWGRKTLTDINRDRETHTHTHTHIGGLGREDRKGVGYQRPKGVVGGQWGGGVEGTHCRLCHAKTGPYFPLQERRQPPILLLLCSVLH